MDPRQRSAAEVFQSHLDLAAAHEYQRDIALNFSPDILVLSTYGVYRGHRGITELAELLEQQRPGAAFDYHNVLLQERMAFLEWTADTPNGYVNDGADSFLIENGWVVAQTIHYSFVKK